MKTEYSVFIFEISFLSKEVNIDTGKDIRHQQDEDNQLRWRKRIFCFFFFRLKLHQTHNLIEVR
jgi:hypothetical protein